MVKKKNKNKNKIFELIMGQYISRDDLRILEDSSYYHFPYNKSLELSAWYGYNAKNFDYYNGNRFCKISRKHYPEYTRGYLFGYWYNPIETIEEDKEEELERDF